MYSFETILLCREVVETIRRLLLTGALVLVGENSTMQIVVGILLAQLFIKLYAYYQPFEKQSLDFLSEVATYQVLMVMFIMLLLRDESFRNNNEVFCDVCLVLSSLTLVFADLVYSLAFYETKVNKDSIMDHFRYLFNLFFCGLFCNDSSHQDHVRKVHAQSKEVETPISVNA